MACRVTFKISDQGLVKRDDQVMCIVGNCKQLGMWCHSNVVEMQRSDNESSTWTLVKDLPIDASIQYRYAVCSLHESSDGKAVVVHQWETYIKPREFKTQGSNVLEDGGKFGVVNGEMKVDKGWLTEQTEVRLYFHNSADKKLITIYNAPEKSTELYSYKVSAETVGSTNIPPGSTNTPPGSPSKKARLSGTQLPRTGSNQVPVTIQILNPSGHEPTLQDQYGDVFHDKDYMIFSAQTLHPQCMVFNIEIFKCFGGPGSKAEPLGVAHLLPSNMVDSSGYSKIPIRGNKHELIGELSVQYLVIKPCKSTLCDMSVSYAKYWKKREDSLHIGHRGCGRSGIDAVDVSKKADSEELSMVPENTIASFFKADSHGIDMVETDVLLSKDMVPILFHDFVVKVTTLKKKNQKKDVIEVPVHNLTLEQLQSLEVRHAGDTEDHSTSPDEDNDDCQSFPTLKEALERTPRHVGFNLEIKYPQVFVTGNELEGEFFERNVYLDTILKVILENAGDRRIVFSCFCPDVCVMLRRKQNKYPVMFLTQGETKQWDSYEDQRCSTVNMSLHSTLADDLLGIVLLTELIQEHRYLTEAIKDAGLISMCWGNETRDVKVFEDMKKLGVHGIIYDRVTDYDQPRQNIFLQAAKH